MLKSKEKISSEIVQKPTKRKNNPISPSDSDLINAIDIPFIVLKSDNSIYFINDAAKTFGSSTIVVAIEAIRQNDGSYLSYTDNGREYTGMEVQAWAKEVEERGAGEILLTSIDQEGTGDGFDEKV